MRLSMLKGYVLFGSIIITVSGVIDILFWFLSGGIYFIPSWVAGVFFLATGIAISLFVVTMEVS